MSDPKRPTRAQLLAALGKCQDLFGAIEGRFNNDRGTERAGPIQLMTREGFELCVATLSGEPPAAPAAPQVVDRDGVRAEVRAFALLMEAKLRANEHKGGWQDEGSLSLLRRLREETAELDAVIHHGAMGKTVDTWRDCVGGEAADVANFAMMIADVCGALRAPPPPAAAPREPDLVDEFFSNLRDYKTGEPFDISSAPPPTGERTAGEAEADVVAYLRERADMLESGEVPGSEDEVTEVVEPLIGELRDLATDIEDGDHIGSSRSPAGTCKCNANPALAYDGREWIATCPRCGAQWPCGSSASPAGTGGNSCSE